MHLRWIKRKIEYHVFLFYSIHLFHFDTGPTYITASFSDQAFPLHTLTTKPRSCDKHITSLHSFGLAQVTMCLSLRSTDDNYLPFLYGLSREHLYIAKPFDCKHYLVLEGAKNSHIVVAEFGKIYCRKIDQSVPYLSRLQIKCPWRQEPITVMHFTSMLR